MGKQIQEELEYLLYNNLLTIKLNNAIENLNDPIVRLKQSSIFQASYDSITHLFTKVLKLIYYVCDIIHNKKTKTPFGEKYVQDAIENPKIQKFFSQQTNWESDINMLNEGLSLGIIDVFAFKEDQSDMQCTPKKISPLEKHQPIKDIAPQNNEYAYNLELPIKQLETNFSHKNFLKKDAYKFGCQILDAMKKPVEDINHEDLLDSSVLSEINIIDKASIENFHAFISKFDYIFNLDTFEYDISFNDNIEYIKLDLNCSRNLGPLSADPYPKSNTKYEFSSKKNSAMKTPNKLTKFENNKNYHLIAVHALNTYIEIYNSKDNDFIYMNDSTKKNTNKDDNGYTGDNWDTCNNGNTGSNGGNATPPRRHTLVQALVPWPHASMCT